MTTIFSPDLLLHHLTNFLQSTNLCFWPRTPASYSLPNTSFILITYKLAFPPFFLTAISFVHVTVPGLGRRYRHGHFVHKQGTGWSPSNAPVISRGEWECLSWRAIIASSLTSQSSAPSTAPPWWDRLLRVLLYLPSPIAGAPFLRPWNGSRSQINSRLLSQCFFETPTRRPCSWIYNAHRRAFTPTDERPPIHETRRPCLSRPKSDSSAHTGPSTYARQERVSR
jgi:hypothetical protein